LKTACQNEVEQFDSAFFTDDTGIGDHFGGPGEDV
jgi:hypothetical protein